MTMARSWGTGPAWVPGTVLDVLRALSCDAHDSLKEYVPITVIHLRKRMQENAEA